jgi:hypothetical protein
MKLRFMGAAAAAMLFPLTVLAATVDNPGAVTLTVQAGSSVTVGTQTFGFGSGSIAGTVDGAGALTLPTAAFPPIPIPGFPGFTGQLVQDGVTTGTIDPVNGTASAAATVHVKIAGPGVDPTCQVGPVGLNLDVADATGLPYDMTTGLGTLADSNFAAPASTGCGFLGGLIDGQLGLPSPSGNNNITINLAVSPILIGS